MYRQEFSDYYYPRMPMAPMMPTMPMMPMSPGVPMTPTPPMVPSPTVFPPEPMPMPVMDTTMPPDFEMEPGAPVMQDIMYTQGYLRTQIGRYVKIDFLIGTNMLVDREGTLVDVGISYVIIREAETDDLVLCDIYSIKFVKIYY